MSQIIRIAVIVVQLQPVGMHPFYVFLPVEQCLSVYNNPSSDLDITRNVPLQTLRNLGLWPGLTVSLCNNTFEPTVISGGFVFAS